MRKFLILAVLGLALVACEKEKDEPTPATDASTTVDATPQDSVAPAEDVTSAADVTATTSPAADVTVTD